MSQITIASEEQAWELFRKAVDNDLGDLGEFLDLKLDAWPTLTMHISGKDFHGTVPTRLMPPILDLQKNVHRMYCLLRYGSENLRKLTQDERERLELLVKVGDKIKLNDPIITIESDKSSLEIPSTVEGTIESISVAVGDKVSKGDLILDIFTKKKKYHLQKQYPKTLKILLKKQKMF